MSDHTFNPGDIIEFIDKEERVKDGRTFHYTDEEVLGTFEVIATYSSEYTGDMLLDHISTVSGSKHKSCPSSRYRLVAIVPKRLKFKDLTKK